ncbi:MAG: hypothetical protein JWN36_2615 [Microbacteriaceae bacterium]|nr:hypothetical protein [Microbacteriaceae bacterium]
MPQDLSVARNRSLTVGLAGLGGAVIGLLVGLVGIAAVWIVAFSAALSGTPGAGVPFIVSTGASGADVVATTGPGAIIIPLTLCVVGLVVGVLSARASRRRVGRDNPYR